MPTPSPQPQPASFGIRLASGIAIIIITALFAYLGGWAFTAFVAVMIAATLFELCHLLELAGTRVSRSAAFGAAAAAFAGIRWSSWPVLVPAISVALLVTLAWQLQQSHVKRFGDWASSFAGGLYIGWTGGHLAQLREVPNGLAWVALAFVTVWLADSGAYMVGQLFGRHKLAPRLSPSKTWEGYAGGIMTSTIGGVVVGFVSPIGAMVGGIAGALVGCLCLFGDLIESMLKREAHVKDSGHLIPGHGGVFDRIDSLLWSAVIVFYVNAIIFSRMA